MWSKLQFYNSQFYNNWSFVCNGNVGVCKGANFFEVERKNTLYTLLFLYRINFHFTLKTKTKKTKQNKTKTKEKKTDLFI